jgi:hypothetical protein
MSTLTEKANASRDLAAIPLRATSVQQVAAAIAPIMATPAAFGAGVAAAAGFTGGFGAGVAGEEATDG